MKKIVYILFCLALTLSLSFVVACGNGDGAADTGSDNNGAVQNTEKVAYSVTLLDGNGASVSDVIVKIVKDGESVSMKPTAADGKAEFTLIPDNYTVELSFTGNVSYTYDAASLKLGVEARDLTVTLLSKASASELLYNDATAYYVSVGSYGVEFDSEGYTYFLFAPTEPGRYKFSVESSVPATVGYYGSPMYIYEQNIADPEDTVDGAIFLDIRTYNIGITPDGTTRYLLGVKGEAVGSGVFRVERVSDLELSPEELPWTEYTKTTEIKPFTFGGGTLNAIDVFDVTTTAYLGSDGYYHYGSEDGPIIYLRLASASAYIASFEEMSETQFFGHYVYDENGKFLYKISYQGMLLEYIEAAKAGGNVGIYPLTEDLAVMLKDMGDFLGWYTPADVNRENVLFGTRPVTENAWLFACVYITKN